MLVTICAEAKAMKNSFPTLISVYVSLGMLGTVQFRLPVT